MMTPPAVRLALLWHMHQPYYVDPASGESILPWVRLHALKDYGGMVALLDEFPRVPVTFNLVPSLIEQVEAYALERTWDRHLVLGLAAPGTLGLEDVTWFVREAFHAHAPTMIHPYPRYAELAARRAAGLPFSPGDLRDLQVWQKLAWIDADVRTSDARVAGLVGKGREFDEHDKAVLRAVELELLRRVVPAYRRAADSGRVELSTSPYFHPILPLLCDSAAHHAAHPTAPLPHPPFRRPADARLQVARAVDAHTRWFGRPPAGVWPSEGSVSDAAAACIADAGMAWMATDQDILARSIAPAGLTARVLYAPHALRTTSGEVRVLFRDHALSDLVGFTYQGWEATAAAHDFVGRVRAAGQRARADGAVATPVVTVILDGENAWEHYAGDGRPFLRALYRSIGEAPDIEPITMASAAAGPAQELRSIFAGSWINADFGIWIGHADDRRAWRQLEAARAMFDAHGVQASPASREAAQTALLAAEGSDWFWWYGDDHSSAHDRDFDELFRRYLRRAYEALGVAVPPELHTSNISTSWARSEFAPARVDVLVGAEASYFGQLGSASLDSSVTTMHRAGVDAVDVRIGLTPDGVRVWADAVAGAAWALEIQRDSTEAVVRAIDGVSRMTWADLGVRPGERIAIRATATDGHGHVVRQAPSDGSHRSLVVPGESPARRPWTA